MSAHANEAVVESYVVRKATADDVGAVARIWHVGWADGHLGHVPAELVRHRSEESFATRARERVDGLSRRSRLWAKADTWVAEAQGQILGFVVIKGDELEQIYVDRTARGTGVAALLLRQAEIEIRKAGHRHAWLAVVAGNQRARSFYARLGWRDAGPMSYQAETETGPLAVPTHRYEVELRADGESE